MLIFLYLAVLITALYWVSKMLLPEMAKPSKKVQVNEPDNGTEKLKTLLIEKNEDIQLLQTELKVFQVQVRNFDKIKSLLTEEIDRLREQNRIFRSELGLPAGQLKENSIT